MTLKILNIGIDRDLLDGRGESEAVLRQQFYCRELPAKITHLVKTSPELAPAPRQDGDLAIVSCPVSHWWRFPTAAVRQGAELLQHGAFDVIQVQEPFLSGLAGARLARRFRKPLVVGVYSDEIDNPVWLAERSLNRVANLVGKWVLRRAAAIRCDSAHVASKLQSSGFANVRFVPFLITHAQKLTEDQPGAQTLRAQLLGGARGPLLLAVTRLEPEKNVPLMLRAFAHATAKHPGAVLAIAGDGRLREELEALAGQVAPHAVRWLGRIGNEDMPAHYQAADLTLLSSNRESAARVLSESLLAGTPVLTTDTAGAREVVGEGGRVVPVGDENAFACALVELCGDAARLAALGRTGQDMASRTVGATAVVNALREVYRVALER